MVDHHLDQDVPGIRGRTRQVVDLGYHFADDGVRPARNFSKSLSSQPRARGAADVLPISKPFLDTFEVGDESSSILTVCAAGS
jgi:hypothetical protein